MFCRQDFKRSEFLLPVHFSHFEPPLFDAVIVEQKTNGVEILVLVAKKEAKSLVVVRCDGFKRLTHSKQKKEPHQRDQLVQDDQQNHKSLKASVSLAFAVNRGVETKVPAIVMRERDAIQRLKLFVGHLRKGNPRK